MLYVIHYMCEPKMRDKLWQHYLQKGVSTPAGVKLIANVHTLHQHEGWAIVETDDPVAFGKLMYDWSDLADHEIVPVVDDEGMRAIMGS